jgi:BON domain
LVWYPATVRSGVDRTLEREISELGAQSPERRRDVGTWMAEGPERSSGRTTRVVVRSVARPPKDDTVQLMRALKPSRVWPVAIAILIGSVGCIGRAPVVARDDSVISDDVRTRLAADGQTKPFTIAVDTKAGIVHLSGNVAKDADRMSAERIATETPGVRSVNNDVRYGGVPVPADAAH